MDPGACVFKKINTRKPVKQLVLQNSRNKELMSQNDDTLSFIKQRSVTANENHDWKNKKKVCPGVPMSIIKVVSPNEIILKKMNHNTEILTEKMNKVYDDKKINKKKSGWKINDLCAIFIKKYGNWYRGKIMNIYQDTTKQMVTVYFYDLNETIDQIPIKTLHILEDQCAQVKCGILHCGLNNLVPLGATDGVWPKFSCDRLIEELKKYPTVYFSCEDKKNDIALGEIWVRNIETPQALEPLRERWTNINRFMIEQGFALTNKQVKRDGEYSTSQSESEFNYSNVSKENDEFVNSWMPPDRLVGSQFNVIVTNVDMECHIYFQILGEETLQSLQLITDELNDILSNSQPEPINIKWNQGQSVIVKYHLDNKWYRGTILKISDNGEFTVQFYDYGNIETCKHEDIRSTLYMTEVPQLCHKGFFSSILPITKNGRWPIPTLDLIHSLIVDRTCILTIDASLSTDDHCAIKSMKEINYNLDVFQYLVTEKKAYFEYVSSSIVGLVDTDDDAANDSNCYPADDSICDSSNDDSGLTNNEHESIHDNRLASAYALDKEPVSSVGAILEEDDDDVESGYLKFCLEPKEVIEGIMCRITGPTSLTLVITKIGGVDLSVAKHNLCIVMQEKCSALPPLDRIIPGTTVAAYYHELWQRGVIEDSGKSVLLVDFGISIELRKNNLRPCLPEFLELPMFTIDCQLENVKPSDNANAKDVVNKLSETLGGADLKIVGVSESDNDIVGVELYNNRGEIAYQSLIDAKLLIPV